MKDKRTIGVAKGGPDGALGILIPLRTTRLEFQKVARTRRGAMKKKRGIIVVSKWVTDSEFLKVAIQTPSSSRRGVMSCIY